MNIYDFFEYPEKLELWNILTYSKFDNAECWYLNGQLHREDGPAVIWHNDDGTRDEWWYLNGFYHRGDGPAIMEGIDEDGNYISKHFYIFGINQNTDLEKSY